MESQVQAVIECAPDVYDAVLRLVRGEIKRLGIETQWKTLHAENPVVKFQDCRLVRAEE